MPLTNDPERRRHTRLPFEGLARIHDGTDWHDCDVVDVSLKGVLLRPPTGVATLSGQPFQVDILLGGGVVTISMQAHVAHAKGGLAGFASDQMDLASFAHLRRLLELNLDDPKLLDRELEQLVQRHLPS